MDTPLPKLRALETFPVDQIRRALAGHAPRIIRPTAKHAAVAAVLQETASGT